jgi:hypothetical protein
MHPYTVEDGERRRVHIILGFLSVFLTLALARVTKALAFEMPWWVDSPSVVGFYGLTYALFDRVLWRWRPLRGHGLSSMPVLEGTWSATITSSFDGHQNVHRGVTRIRQTWTHILISLETGSSTSRSIAACASFSADQYPLVWYLFQNTPRAGATITMEAHVGAATMRVKDDALLEEEYFSGRGRTNYGTIVLTREHPPQ